MVSIEPPHAPIPRAEGFKAVIEKGRHFATMIEARHGGSVSDPIVSGNYFTTGWTMDVTMKGMGRASLQEVCVYRVEEGKIVWEEFFY
ncbi:MAG: SnoaL-like domain-containing protein [Chitinophagales bacterium]